MLYIVLIKFKRSLTSPNLTIFLKLKTYLFYFQLNENLLLMNINTSEGKQTHWAAYVFHSKKNKNIKPYLQSIQLISYLSKLVQ